MRCRVNIEGETKTEKILQGTKGMVSMVLALVGRDRAGTRDHGRLISRFDGGSLQGEELDIDGAEVVIEFVFDDEGDE